MTFVRHEGATNLWSVMSVPASEHRSSLGRQTARRYLRVETVSTMKVRTQAPSRSGSARASRHGRRGVFNQAAINESHFRGSQINIDWSIPGSCARDV